MKTINWKQLSENCDSAQKGFEQLCYQVAYREFNTFGQIDNWYNTPGSEFYLTLDRDSSKLNLKAGDIVGWQAKFWLNNKDEENSPLISAHREELIKGFKTSLDYKPGLKKWIICTPGKFSNTKPHKCVDALENGIKSIKEDIQIEYWNKDTFIALALEDNPFYSLLFNYFFSAKFIDFEFINRFSEKSLRRLQDKFDIDLYVENDIDQYLDYIINPIKAKEKVKDIMLAANRYINRNYPFRHNELKQYKYLDNSYIAKLKEFIDARCKLVNDIDENLKTHSNLSLIEDIMQTYSDKYKNTVDELNKLIDSGNYISKPKKKSNKYYNEENFHDSCLDFAEEIKSFISSSESINARSLKYYLDLYSTRHIHVVGSAGYGKTNLACAICQKHLTNKIPALLILGSNIKGHSSPQEQIISSLDLKNDYTFKEFLFALNEQGKWSQQKVPIVIDGLNESVPTAKMWRGHICDLIYDVSQFDNLLLITTLRGTYVRQVFEVDSILKVENHYKIEGFSNHNIKYAVRKYFDKYNIESKGIINEHLFKNPLMLKVFCEANKNSSDWNCQLI